MTTLTNKKEIQLYNLAKNFLLRKIDSKNIDLEKYMHPEIRRSNPQDFSTIYKSILESAQNLQMSPNVIGKSISGIKGNIDPLGDSLNNFDPHQINKSIGHYNEKELFNLLKLKFRIKSEKTKLWFRYCKTIISSSIFLSKFESVQQFYEFIDQLYKSENTKNILPLLLSIEIDGYGIALSCDFLKELGYVQYGKPDTHIKDIFIAAKYFEKHVKNTIKVDYYSLQIFDMIAKSNKTTAYNVDKIFWLICTGSFYQDNIKIGSNKDEFIQLLNKEFK